MTQPTEQIEYVNFADISVPKAYSLPANEGTKEYITDCISNKCYYAYGLLSDTDKTLYNELFSCINDLRYETDISTLDSDKISEIFALVMADHPEFFYINGFQYTTYLENDVVRKLSFRPCYTESVNQIIALREQIEEQVIACLDAMPQTEDEYEKVKYFYEYIVLNTEYDLNSEQNQNIYSVFVNHISVCQGYAKAFQYLCQRAGLEALLISGTVKGEGHAWNFVRVNGSYYYVDPTWGDASYTFSNGGMAPKDSIQPINYDYFLITENALKTTHVITSKVELPLSVDTKDNYFIRENLYLDSCDKAKYKEIFKRIYEQNQRCISIKCSDYDVFVAVRDELITQQKVFDYLKFWDNTIAFTDNPKQLTISFWI